jgi:hypothetical protein
MPSRYSRRDVQETGAVGICKFNKLMIIRPARASAIVGRIRSSTVPSCRVARSNRVIWLHEDMARFYETRWRNAGQGRAEII